MRCQHENAEHMMPGDTDTPDWSVQVYAQCEQFRCIDCGAWLSLGPSNDDKPNVREEIRAAEIVAEHDNARGRLGVTGDMTEINGWCSHNTEAESHEAGEPAYQAGYLARCIVEHGKERP
jgi:hypothetical protein